ncbi:MAG TPA: hypothetical protein VFJ27_07340, partial [Terriglobia bacterium]|nr:hypothetical protein [Terriglobia bacterium]
WFSQLWHPSDEDLIAFLDGDAAGGTSRRVHRHLTQCWSCRARREEFDLSITGFLKSREHLLESLSGNQSERDGQITRQFESKLRTAALEEDLRSPTPNETSTAGRRWHLLFSLPLAASLLAIVGIFYGVAPFNRIPTVSAQEILRRVSEEGIRHIAQVAKPVVHQKFRVARRATRSRAEAVTWETWNDQENRRVVQRVTDADPDSAATREQPNQQASLLLAELQAVFRQNGYDANNPLSSENHERWRSSLTNRSEEVVETSLPAGDAALVVKTEAAGPHLPQSIIQAELVVRRGDWHPVEQRLQVQGHEQVYDYEITERSFEVVTLTALPPALFAEAAPPPPAIVISPKPVSHPATASEAELLAAEIQAHYALHQLKACLGKPIHVSRNAAGGIEVGGLVETAEEREELKAALRSVPGAILKVQTVAEAMQTSASAALLPTEVPGASSETRSVTVRSGPMPLRLPLQQYFNKNGLQGETADPVANLSNGAVTLSRNIMAEAWALRHLAERYRGNRKDKLPPYARLLLQNMVQDHMSSLRLGVEKARQLLEPALSSLFADEPAGRGRLGGPADSARVWSETCLDLFGRADEVRGIVDGLFAGVESDVQPEIMARRLLEVLSHWTSQFPRIEIEIARQLSGEAPSLVQRAGDRGMSDSKPSRP